jgi:hypothetical protein
MNIGVDGDAGTIETKGWPWARRTQETPVVLMLVMVLGAIKGFTDAKAAHQDP